MRRLFNDAGLRLLLHQPTETTGREAFVRFIFSLPVTIAVPSYLLFLHFTVFRPFFAQKWLPADGLCLHFSECVDG